MPITIEIAHGQAKELFTKCAQGYEAVCGPDYEWARRARDILKTL